MMICSLNRIDEFISFFDLIHDTCDTLRLNFNNDGLNVNVLNKSHVCFYELNVKKEYFIDYNVEDIDEVIIDCAEYYNVLSKLKGYDTIVFNLEDGHLEILGLKEDNRIRFMISLIGADYSSPQPPKLEYNSWCEVQLSDLKNASDILEKVCKTDRFRIIYDETTGFQISSSNESMTGYNQTLMVNGDGQGEVIVNTSYLTELSKLKKINTIVKIRLGNTIPLSWSISNDFDDITANGLIAPIMEEE